ncbi:hypothetical protein [Flavobacterium sp. YO64]|uniref:hypothetical protein n=1 Tax=Flavobacterium sp. YO64 TaxID=394559 RepID=UPI00100ACBC7|nr:hypothetical protein [Flavobacterium sp. YO64]RXM42661.1 hypothetical protein BOW57_15875 [Flavobacterium sp. YO64]
MKRIELEHLIIYMRVNYEGKAKINSDTILKEFKATPIKDFTVSQEIFSENIDAVRKFIMSKISIYTLID